MCRIILLKHFNLMPLALLNCGQLASPSRERLLDYYGLRLYGFFGGKHNYLLTP